MKNQLFQIICTTKSGSEIVLFGGKAFPENKADKLARSHRGGIGEQIGNRYTARLQQPA